MSFHRKEDDRMAVRRLIQRSARSPAYSYNNLRIQRPVPRSVVKKTLAIAYIKAPGIVPRFLIVLDRASREWSFISGCCKLHERPEACVIRELREETKEGVNVWLTPWNHRQFEIQYWRNEDDGKSNRTLMHYHCYAIDISNYRPQNEIIEHFRNSKKAGKCYNENTDLTFATLDQFKEKKVWPFIKKDVLESKEFKSIYATISKN